MTNTSKTTAAAGAAIRQQLAEGFQLVQQGRSEDAAKLCDVLLAAHAANPEVLYFASEVRSAAGDHESALGLIDAAIEAAPGQLPLLLKKAHHLIQLRRRTDARGVADEAAAIAGRDAQSLWAIGRIHGRCDDPTTARRYYERALAAGAGGNPALHYDLAGTQFFAGDFAAAEENLDALLAVAPRAAHALYLRSTLRRQTPTRNHVAELQALLDAGFADAGSRAVCLFALAKEHEDLGESEESFSTLREAAALKRASLRYDAAAERDTIDAIRVAWTREAMQRNDAGHEEEGAIFIVGMPRTGTTLVERMLGRHSDVASAGELQDFGQVLAEAARRMQLQRPDKSLVEASLLIDFAALGRDYMIGARQAAPASRFFIDKMPINFMYCGLIHKALPRARIIHLVRDPMDTCYAVYKTLFNQAYHFSYQLDELGDYYLTYDRLMRHWHAVMPDAILDVRYEDLVADTETQARRILAWCGLDWQPAVLDPARDDTPSTTASAAQVREPVHTDSIGKWRRYDAGLEPLRARLAAAGVVGAG